MSDYIVAPHRPALLVAYNPPNEVANFRRLTPSPAGGPLFVAPEFTIPMIHTTDVWMMGTALLQLGAAGYTLVPRKGVVLNKPGDGSGGGSTPIPEYGQLWPLRG